MSDNGKGYFRVSTPEAQATRMRKVRPLATADVVFVGTKAALGEEPAVIGKVTRFIAYDHALTEKEMRDMTRVLEPDERTINNLLALDHLRPAKPLDQYPSYTAARAGMGGRFWVGLLVGLAIMAPFVGAGIYMAVR